MIQKLSVLVLGLAMSSLAHATAYVGPVLVYKLGADAHGGVKKTCEIYESNEELKKSLKGEALSEKLARVAKQPITKALHIMASNPSTEYTAILVRRTPTGDKAQSVLLLHDYSTTETREGAEAEELRRLIDRLCQGK